MSDREKIVQLLDEVPAYKLGYILAYVQGLTADEDADDAYCEQLYQKLIWKTLIAARPSRRTKSVTARYCFMSYTILYEKPALKFIQKQPKEQQRRILEAVHALPDSGEHQAVEGSRRAAAAACWFLPHHLHGR